MNIYQFNKKQAIAIAESGIWKEWSDEEIVRVQLFQNLLCMKFSRFHEAVEKILKRPVYTHEFAFKDNLVQEYLGNKQAPTFDEIINLIPEEKRLIIISKK